MIYEEDYCDLFEQELLKGAGDRTMKYCELCELQRSAERSMSGMSVDMKKVKEKLNE